VAAALTPLESRLTLKGCLLLRKGRVKPGLPL
jgi:hypothetical protein